MSLNALLKDVRLSNKKKIYYLIRKEGASSQEVNCII